MKDPRIRRLVLDVLKPHQPRIDVLALDLGKLEGLDSVNIIRTETDRSTEGIIVTMVGQDLDYELIEETLRDYGCSIHSVDEVVVGEQIIDTVRLPEEEDLLK
ncbi:MAG: DUF211 domain-containing protein [Candidatus Heimdallarchaeaceae archaeon]|uniref:DUF211 domain-containing protein n=1 Tax=Candidatus Heimdallarchaeum endolithica TaxID=2876572 RepID=A0A9Y1BS66_9ARCH|nr:MAG: DUF211 domain-containing protein [Candidatus Heimdallarchaeum endolithica]